MAIAPNTNEFFNIRTDVNRALDDGTISNKEDLSVFLKKYELDADKFLEVLNDYEKQSDYKRNRANNSTFDISKVAAAGAADYLSLVPKVGLDIVESIGGKEARKATVEASKDIGGYVEAVLPKSVVYAAKETVDPKLNTAEQIAADIIAIGNLQKNITQGVAKVFPRLLDTRYGKLGTFFGTEIAADVALRDRDEQITPAIAELLDYGIDNIIETEEEKIAGEVFNLSPETVTYINALKINPEDGVAKRRLKQIVDAAVVSGVATATIEGVLRGGSSIANKLSSIADNAISNTRRPTINTDGITSDVNVTRVGQNQYEYRGKFTEIVGKINTTLGRGLASKSALPTNLFKAEMRKRNFATSQQLGVDKDAKSLMSLMKKANLTRQQEDLVNRVFKGEQLTEDEILQVPQNIYNLVLKMRNNINANQDYYKVALGLQDYGQLGLTVEKGKRKEIENIIDVLEGKPNARIADRDTLDLYNSMADEVRQSFNAQGVASPSIKRIHKKLLEKLKKGKLGQAFTDKEGIYYTYNYEFATNPNWNRKIMQAVKGELDTTNPNNIAINRIVEQAKQYIRSQPGILTEDHVNATISELLDKVQGKDNIQGILEILNPSQGGQASRVQKILKGRKNIPEPILNLLGRVDDPARNYIETMSNQHNLIAKVDFYNFLNDFARQNMDKEIELGGLFPIPKQTTTFSRTPSLSGGISSKYDLGNLASKDLGFFGAPEQKLGLSGIYTTKEMYEILERGIDTFNINRPITNTMLSVVNKPMAYAQAAETVFDQQAHALNVYGGMQSLAANGYMFDGNLLKNSQDGLLTLMSKYANGDESALRMINLLKERGVIDSNPISEGVKLNLRKRGPSGKSSLQRAREEGADYNSMKEVLGDIVEYLPEKTSELYGMPDDLMKIIGVMSEQQNLRRIFPNASEQEIFERAVETVLDVFPSYSNASAAVRALARLPIGNYAVFPIESLRNLKNMVKFSFRDMREGKATGNPELFKYGMKRLLSTAGVLTGYGAVGYTINSSMGVSEDNKRAVDMMSPGWQKSSSKWFTQPFELDPETGEIYTRFVDSGALDTYQYGKAPVIQSLKLALEGQDLTDREVDDMFDQIFIDLSSPYFSEKRLPTAIINVIRDVDEKGRKQNRTFTENVKELLQPFVPGLINSFVREADALESEKLLGEGKGVTSSGFPNRLKDAKLATRTGIRNNTMNVTKSIGYSMYEDSQDIKAVDDRINRMIKEIPVKVLSEQEMDSIVEKYIDLQLERHEAMGRMKDKIDVLSNITFQVKNKDGTMRTEKLTNQGVLVAVSDMGDKKISNEVNYAVSNRFLPKKLNKSELKTLLLDRQLPTELINRLQSIDNKLTGIELRKATQE